MSSLFVEERVSIPGKAEAILRNKGCDFALTDNNEDTRTNIGKKINLKNYDPLILTLILKPAFALVSTNMIPNSFDLASPSSIETCL